MWRVGVNLRTRRCCATIGVAASTQHSHSLEKSLTPGEAQRTCQARLVIRRHEQSGPERASTREFTHQNGSALNQCFKISSHT